MGLDIYQQVIVGFKVLYRKKLEKVKKYHEDTGQLYFVDKETFIPYCDNSVLQEDCLDDREDSLQKFVFGNPRRGEEYDCLWGKSVYVSQSHRNVDDPFEMFTRLDLDFLKAQVEKMKSRFPDKDVGVYCLPQASW